MAPPAQLASRQSEPFTATVSLLGHEFPFQLYTRPVNLGPDVTVHYFWMDSSQFRTLDGDATLDNFRNCVGHWAAAMRREGLMEDPEQQIHYVCAVCYPLVARSKSLQDVYKDAYLAPGATLTGCSLPDDVRQRIRAVADSRNRSGVQEELDRTLGRFEPPPRVLPALQEAFRRWVGKGVSLLRRRDNDGLVLFLQEVDSWLARYRKKGGHAWVRHFINLFAYECKVSFHTCYANAWADLIPWLRQHRGLDEVSERFLRFWHYQNQPVEVPHGRTAGGIYYPTHGRASVVEADPDGRPRRHSLTWQTEHMGPTHARDVLSGQVLSLHPLSAFFMKDEALCAVAGRFFGSDAYDRVMRRGQADLCAEYWDLVGAILTAAHLYRQTLEAQTQGRGVRECDIGGADAAVAEVNQTDAGLLEDFAAASGMDCPRCGGALTVLGYHPAVADDASFEADFSCRACFVAHRLRIERAQLERWLLPEE